MNASDPGMIDNFGRRFGYVRLSVTEICNFRCLYCLPDGYRKTADPGFLTPDEILRLVRALTGLGIRKLRLTGGEPTIRTDLTEIITRVAAVPGISKCALTTNGWNLDRHAAEWVEAGLTHLNVSVDSLDPAQFAGITGHDRLDEILAGIDRALSLPLAAVKLNAVLLADSVSEGFGNWAEYVRHRRLSVRFIELMRTGDNREFFSRQHVSGNLLRQWLDTEGWVPCARGADDGPAVEFSHPDFQGRIGLIAPYAPGFCDGCNRLRVTARGRLRLCLFASDGPDSPDGCDLRDLLRHDGQTDALHARVLDALRFKRAGHALHAADPGNLVNLSRTGG